PPPTAGDPSQAIGQGDSETLVASELSQAPHACKQRRLRAARARSRGPQVPLAFASLSGPRAVDSKRAQVSGGGPKFRHAGMEPKDEGRAREPAAAGAPIASRSA